MLVSELKEEHDLMPALLSHCDRVGSMDFTQTLGLNAGFWYMSNFSISYQISNVSANKSETIDIFPYFVTETPFGLSYSCSYLPQIPPRNITNIGRGINITFEQLQVAINYIIYPYYLL
jgi:hypothetical protein